jgi:serine protease Do
VRPVVALTAVATIVGVAPSIALTKTAKAPLWEDRTVTALPPAGQAVDWARLARELKPAVVHVTVSRPAEKAEKAERGDRTPERMPEWMRRFRAPFGDSESFEEFFRKNFGDLPRHPMPGAGTGFIISRDGHILTNNHVTQRGSDIVVKLSDGREFAAKVVGRDPKTDLALLKIEAKDLPVIPLGDSTTLQVGEPVMAIGNPFGLEQTVTTGIVSATGRVIGQGPYDDFIQTDASINPGNSGGPLINAQGQAVGVTTAIFSQGGGSVGIGFAIPVNLAKSVVTQLAETGQVVRGWLGVTIQPLTAELAKSFKMDRATGALVASVAEDSPAKKAELRRGDVVTEFDGRPVTRPADLSRAVADTLPGREVPVTVLRDGKPVTLTVKIGKLDEMTEARATETPEAKGRLGLAVEPLTAPEAKELGLADGKGLVVRSVRDGSPAASAGIQERDVIVEVNREPVKSVSDLRERVEKHPKDRPMLLLIQRNGTSLYVAVNA